MVYGDLTAGTASSSQSICYNTSPSQLTSVDPTGGNTPYTYQWQTSTDNSTFSDISGATLSTYSSGALTQTTYYRLKQTSASSCGSVYTNAVTITVYGDLTAGSASSSQSICYNTAPAQLTSVDPIGGNTPYTYQWQTSTDNSTFSDISGATLSTYSPGALTQTTYYRLKQTSSSSCGSVYTGVVTITVYGELTVGSASSSQSICYNTSLSQLTSIDPTGGNTPYTYQWQSSTDNSTFSDISGATLSTYSPGALTQTTYYRLKQTSSSSCGSVYTGTVLITVEPAPVSGTLSKSPNSASICEGTDVSASFTSGSGGNGTDVLQYRTKTGGTWSDWAIYTSGDVIQTFGKSEIEIRTYRTATYCSNALPNTVAWTINPTTAGGNVTGGTQVCYGSNSTLLTLSGHTGTVVKWQRSLNNTLWSDISGTTNTTYTAVNVTENSFYRAIIASGVCSSVASTSTQITVFTDFHISGYAKYENNPRTILDGLKITLKKNGSTVAATQTNAAGFYDFGGLVNGIYSIEVTSAHPSGLWQTWGGVNNTDALLVQNHITGTMPLPVNPPVIRKTASVKVPHPAIDNADYNAIRTAAKAGWGYFDIPKWVFTGVDATSRIDTLSVNCSNLTRDIRGLCAGDVNGTYIPSAGYKISKPGIDLVNNGIITVNNEMVFPVRINRSMELGAMTLFLNYDQQILRITGVDFADDRLDQPFYDTREGVLYIGWVSTETMVVDKGQTILLIHARLLSGKRGNDNLSGQAADIRFTLNDNPLSEFADPDGNVISGLTLTMPDAGSIRSSGSGRDYTMVCYPNPASESINVEFETTQAKPANLVMMDTKGVRVLTHHIESSSPGWVSEKLDVRSLAPGVYFIMADFDGWIITKKAVIFR
jgi:hypothetical protein